MVFIRLKRLFKFVILFYSEKVVKNVDSKVYLLKKFQVLLYLLKNIDCYILADTREGTPGRHDPPPRRHEPPIFARQTEPPPCSKSLRYAVNEPPLYSTAFSKPLLYICRTYLIFFQHSGTIILFKINVVY